MIRETNDEIEYGLGLELEIEIENKKENKIKDLEYTTENGWINLDENKKKEIFKFADEYKIFLDNSKTERDATKFVIHILKENGFVNLEDREYLNDGDRVYFVNNQKSVYAAIVKDNILDGLNIIGSHIDSPRLDLKTKPLFENSELAYFKTHYYGGIKKYQWLTIPLALKGVVCLTNGENIEINIGEDEEDPIFMITDLLPHLARNQMNKKASELVTGEELNILIGGIPYSEKEGAKIYILNMLNEKYGIKEIDFTSSELLVVPAGKSRDLGFDRSFVAGYGQDDKVCAYASLRSFIEYKNINKTNVLILSDKEEIGSKGNTGMESELFDYFIQEILNKFGKNYIGALNKVYYKSRMLSADVDAAYDPNYPQTYDLKNSAKISHGVNLNKYTGSAGKYMASDANAEFVRDIRKIFEENNIKYQVSTLGKVDAGGGGTVAYILANKGINVLDCGIGVLSMHAPMEISSKFDIYEMYKGYKVFFEN